uniref:Uncharacterized protein LOC111104124 n=1 Tax=Crassostrea virginica TaxID=6565 RepID=A0A8B8ATR1_CRAVI|nr:uncharacterized protein LOC111104124 [Crassostrea virginica]XP_022293608.1 uncharacterized protein LOC111104124 [Crassostrea virginica]XP_022293609.1 uncharacterized protein LOC111104124 [Crassostrea virginica]XP_022293610.1 uncharacterized protein LOC111104124 [Crassostrea virginica]XP_022293611.1 uncharacterized protein LOC111104124 [Crassostrea virginica]XP_022293612.1 uncharacterized protein LOC111104124 [Crassostrea virginica]XP_022293613.1 uncharacterized protein LOC111104124 [Crasso
MDYTSVTTQQPLSFEDLNRPPQPVLPATSPVVIRNATASPEDRKFLGEVVVMGFERKFAHATSQSKLPLMKTYYEKHTSGRPPLFYERYFIAEYDGERAGACCLRYQGDDALFPERDEDLPNFGCCDLFGLCLMDLATKTDIPAGKAYVDHICVLSKFRGKGIGKTLLDMTDMDASKRGCKSIFLWVSTSNPAQHLYERQGYVTKETTSPFSCCMYCMIGEKEFALMEKDL